VDDVMGRGIHPDVGEDFFENHVVKAVRQMAHHGAPASRDVNWRAVLKRDPCSFCGRTAPLVVMTIDHVTAKADGGHPSAVVNGAGVCMECNGSKGKMSLLTFLAMRLTIV
jgi:5-methylcytosine-specific restriction endonuclease McrA